MNDYPILLIHGTNCRNDGKHHYFDRIPQMIEEQGKKCYLLYGDAWGTIAHNCELYRWQIKRILSSESCEKVHLIAHSKGGLEARYLVSTMEFAPFVASVTTLSTPHQGSRTAAVWEKRPLRLHFIGRFLEMYWRQRGDLAPDVVSVVHSLTPDAMAEFNQNNPDVPGIVYRSFGAVLAQGHRDYGMACLAHCLTHWDGETDGLVSPDSARWSKNHQLLSGVSHRDVVDNRRKKSHCNYDWRRFWSLLLEWLAEI